MKTPDFQTSHDHEASSSNFKETEFPKIAFHTFGCRLNQSETAVIQGHFQKEDYCVVDIREPADIAVINTCTVTENGDADTRRLVNRLNRLNPAVRIALIGCQAQIQKQKLADLPNVKWIVGNENKMDLHKIILSLDDDQPALVVPPITKTPFTIDGHSLDQRKTRVNLKIQDGCDFFCSFCEIPFARGRARSRVFSDIVREARIVCEAGCQEVVLTGINIGTYAYEGYRLIDVISALEDLSGLKRIRISSIEPTTIDMKIIQKMSGESKLCRYLHIPLQSASDKVLSSMKRKYTSEDFFRFISEAHERVEDICIGTDCIVGFPGERQEDFEATCQALEDWPLHYAHVFSYSDRHVAKSKGLLDAVDRTEIYRRSRRLQSISRRQRVEFAQKFVGRQMDVLFEQEKEGAFSGWTENFLKVFVESDEDLSNQYRAVKILSTGGDGQLKGDLV